MWCTVNSNCFVFIQDTNQALKKIPKSKNRIRNMMQQRSWSRFRLTTHPKSNNQTLPAHPFLLVSDWSAIGVAWKSLAALSCRTPGSRAVINHIYDLNPKPTQPLPERHGSACRAPISPQMSLIPHKPEKTRHWKQRRKSCGGMRAGRVWALISHVCCCQTKCLCCWEVFPCLALSYSNWDFIYYHQI